MTRSIRGSGLAAASAQPAATAARYRSRLSRSSGRLTLFFMSPPSPPRVSHARGGRLLLPLTATNKLLRFHPLAKRCRRISDQFPVYPAVGRSYPLLTPRSESLHLCARVSGGVLLVFVVGVLVYVRGQLCG